MGKYNHDNIPNQRAAQFVSWCKQNITEWPDGAVALANFTGNKFKNYSLRTHYSSLCYSWSVCTKRHWMDALHEDDINNLELHR